MSASFSAGFSADLAACLERHSTNRHVDNSWPWYHIGRRQAMYLDILGLESMTKEDERRMLEEAKATIPAVAETMAPLYERLADEPSRETLLLLAAYRLLGRRHVKFPYYGEQNIHNREMLAVRTRMPDPTDLAPLLGQLRREWGEFLACYNLFAVNRNLVLISTPETLFMEHYCPAYRYERDKVRIQVEPGDVVIDCGAGLGDQAAFFADKAGPEGFVAVLEPHPVNSKACYENMRRNPGLKGRMSIITAGAWSGNATLELALDGGGSTLDALALDIARPGSERCSVRCRAIDDIVTDLPRPGVSFIKMDIEGAEIEALKGAAATIEQRAPKLAVSVYHDPAHFRDIPATIDAIRPGYRFYLGHHSMDFTDTVLYAVM